MRQKGWSYEGYGRSDSFKTWRSHACIRAVTNNPMEIESKTLVHPRQSSESSVCLYHQPYCCSPWQSIRCPPRSSAEITLTLFIGASVVYVAHHEHLHKLWTIWSNGPLNKISSNNGTQVTQIHVELRCTDNPERDFGMLSLLLLVSITPTRVLS